MNRSRSTDLSAGSTERTSSHATAENSGLSFAYSI
jgi:hypothetical protein